MSPTELSNWCYSLENTGVTGNVIFELQKRIGCYGIDGHIFDELLKVGEAGEIGNILGIPELSARHALVIRKCWAADHPEGEFEKYDEQSVRLRAQEVPEHSEEQLLRAPDGTPLDRRQECAAVFKASRFLGHPKRGYAGVRDRSPVSSARNPPFGAEKRAGSRAGWSRHRPCSSSGTCEPGSLGDFCEELRVRCRVRSPVEVSVEGLCELAMQWVDPDGSGLVTGSQVLQQQRSPRHSYSKCCAYCVFKHEHVVGQEQRWLSSSFVWAYVIHPLSGMKQFSPISMQTGTV